MMSAPLTDEGGDHGVPIHEEAKASRGDEGGNRRQIAVIDSAVLRVRPPNCAAISLLPDGRVVGAFVCGRVSGILDQQRVLRGAVLARSDDVGLRR